MKFSREMRYLSAILPIFLFAMIARGADSVLSINKFGGLDTDTAEVLLQDNETPDSENVITDEFSSLGPRKGFVQYSTNSASNIWTFPHSNGTRYIIIQSSGNILADTGPGTFLTLISTVSQTDTTVATVLGDKFFFANKTDGLKYWDTSTITVASASLKVDNLVTWKGRLAASGKVGAERTIYLSKFLVGTSWDTPVNPSDDDPTQITVSGALDEKITALYPAFNDILIWFKQTAFGGIYGTRRSNFTQRTFSDRVGTAYRDSIQDCDGILKWLGPQRTIWGFDGTNYQKISEKIDSMMATAAQGDANARRLTTTSKDDWDVGSIGSGLSTSESPGNVAFSTFGIVIDDFSDNNYTSNPVWSTGGGGCLASASASSGYLEIQSGCTFSGNDGYVYTNVSPSTNIVEWTSDVTFTTLGIFSFYFINQTSAINNGFRVELSNVSSAGNDRINVYRNTTLIGSVVIGDFSTSTKYTIKATRDSSGVMDFYLDNVFKLTATDTTSFTRNYLMLAVLKQNIADPTAVVRFDNVRVGTTTATYQSKPFNIGASITAWNTLDAVYADNGGSHSFSVYTDTNSSITVSNPSTWISSQTITPGALISIATASYISFVDVFSRSDYSQTPVLSEVSINWVEGNQTRVASAWSNQRYWLGLAVNSTSNNKVFVHDRNGNWQRYSGVSANAMNIHNSSLYFANASGVFQAETGTSDAGAAITSYYKTKSWMPSGPDSGSIFHDLYMKTMESGATLNTSFFINGRSSPNALGSYTMDTDTGNQSFKLPFPFGDVQRGKDIAVKWSVSSTNNWQIYNGNLYYRVDPFPN